MDEADKEAMERNRLESKYLVNKATTKASARMRLVKLYNKIEDLDAGTAKQNPSWMASD